MPTRPSRNKGKMREVKVEPSTAASSMDTVDSEAHVPADGHVGLTVTVHVYISRLLLYMIAHPAIRVLLTHLAPPVNAPPRPVDVLPK
jgi:hypothetical protein